MKDRLSKRIRCATVLSFLGVLVLIVSAICVRDPVILKLALSIGVTIFFISLILLFSFFTKEKRNRLVMLLFSYFVPGILLFLGGTWLFILGIRLVIVGVMFIMGNMLIIMFLAMGFYLLIRGNKRERCISFMTMLILFILIVFTLVIG